MIHITEKAKGYLIGQMAKHDKEYVLLQAKGGGCAGFKYDWSYPNKEDLNDKDTFIQLKNGHTLIIDRYSEFKLVGMNIDYIESLAGSSLEIINPNAKSSCGCGESFSV